MELTTQQYIDFMNRITELERKVNKSDFSAGLEALKAYLKEQTDFICKLDPEKDHFNTDEIRGRWNACVGMLDKIKELKEKGF